MFRLIVTALALAALLISPALLGTASAKVSAKPKATAARSHAVKKPAAKSHVAKRSSKVASKAKARGKNVARGKAARGKAAKGRGGKKAVAIEVKLTPERRNALLEEAAALNEDLIGLALDGKGSKVAEKVVAMRRMLPVLRPVLGGDALEELTGHVARMEQDSASNEILTTALDSADAFRTLQEAVDPAQRTSPLEVRMLDYVGYKLTILVVSPYLDWASISATAKEANVAWSRLEEKVPEASLQSVLETVHRDLNDAVVLKDIQRLKLALKKQIDAVDTLDRYYSGAGKTKGGEAR